MWTGDTLEDDPKPRPPWQPARGVVGSTGGKKTLSFYVYVEPFANGARPVVEVQLREDRPHEVAFRVFSSRGGAPMRACVLTATMGNYARLRRLWLKDRVEEAHRALPVGPVRHGRLCRPPAVGRRRVARGQRRGCGRRPARRARPHACRLRQRRPPAAGTTRARLRPSTGGAGRRNLAARVNARKTYWASNAAIPGGVAFENFELEAPFRPGQEFVFGITPELPAALGFHHR